MPMPARVQAVASGTESRSANTTTLGGAGKRWPNVLQVARETRAPEEKR